MSTNLLHIKVSGPDHPGITAELMKSVSQESVELIDMGQSITHGLLSLSFLLDFKDENKPEDSNLIKELVFVANKMKMNLAFEKVPSTKVHSSIGDKYILSCVSTSNITAGFLFEISATLAKHHINIQRIDNLKTNDFKSLEIQAIAPDTNTNWPEVKSTLMSISNKFQTDMALLKDNVWRRNKRLIIFDMDSTLIRAEVIVEMAKLHGVGEEVHQITERAMNGELNFDESLTKRVSLLAGLDIAKLSELKPTIQLNDGVADFIKTVKKLGYKVGIISGGFQYFADHFKNELGLDYAFANQLEVVGGKLTGKLQGPIVNAEKKSMLLEMLAQQENINLEQVVAIGDGANDLHMLSKAGLGIAFHAKEIVKKSAEQSMSHGPMTSILHFLGIPEN